MVSHWTPRVLKQWPGPPRKQSNEEWKFWPERGCPWEFHAPAIKVIENWHMEPHWFYAQHEERHVKPPHFSTPADCILKKRIKVKNLAIPLEDCNTLKRK